LSATFEVSFDIDRGTREILIGEEEYYHFTHKQGRLRMEFSELLVKRRSVRDYEDRKVPLEVIKEILDDSIKAPNAGNMQMWRFVIVTHQDKMKEISDACKKAMLADIDENPGSGFKVYEERIRAEDFNAFYNAPALVFIVGSARARMLPVDSGLLASYLMLSATSRGLGSCYIGQGTIFKDPGLWAELNIPEDYRIYSAIILGYPREIPPMLERKEPKILKTIE
jgi:nitroreductase